MTDFGADCPHTMCGDLRRAAELLAYQVVLTEQIGPPEGTALEHFRRMPADRAWLLAMRLLNEAEAKFEEMADNGRMAWRD